LNSTFVSDRHPDEEDLRKMPSNARSVRETQEKYYESAIESRRNLLIERGVDKDRIRKDPHLKHLQARLRKTAKRIGAIQALEKQKEELALRKQKKLEAKTAEKPEGSAEEGKKKPKKKKKKEES
jgi:hypothetical protein